MLLADLLHQTASRWSTLVEAQRSHTRAGAPSLPAQTASPTGPAGHDNGIWRLDGRPASRVFPVQALERWQQLWIYPNSYRTTVHLVVIALALWATKTAIVDPNSPMLAPLWLPLLVLAVVPWLPWRLPRPGWDVVIAVLVAGAALIPRILELASLPLGVVLDEAQFLVVDERITHSPLLPFADGSWGIPVVGWLWHTGFAALLGETITAGRLSAAVAGALTVGAVYLWGTELQGRSLGIIAAGLLLCAHVALFVSRIGMLNAPTILVVTVACWLTTAAARRRSLAFAAAAGPFVILSCLSYAGGRLILPVLAITAVWLALTRRVRPLRVGLALLATTVLLGVAPIAYYLSAPGGMQILRGREANVSLFEPELFRNASQGLDSPTWPAVLQRQLGETLSVLNPDSGGDSYFYHFARPMLDPISLMLLAAGVVLAGMRVRQDPAWLLPIGLTLGAFAAGVFTANAPYELRLVMGLPSMALLAAAPLVALANTAPSPMVRAVTMSVPILLVSALNTKWFFSDYPVEGTGPYDYAAVGLLSSANVPVYIVNKDFTGVDVVIKYLDRSDLIKPAGANASLQDHAIWAAIGTNAPADMQTMIAQHPNWRIVTLRDNHGQARVTALVPPDVPLSIPESATNPTAWIAGVTDGSAWTEPWSLWTAPKRT